MRFTRHNIKTTAGLPTSGWVVTTAPLYDELNRLQDKRLHASNYDGISAINLSSAFNYLQSLDYSYNIRGWITGMNDAATCTTQGGDQLADLFTMGLDYENTTNGATAQYNGNIAAMQWRTNVNGTCLARQQYRFTYDFANRLLAANHFTHNGTAWVNTNNYSESNITYDLNGNIKTYNRRGQMPNLSFNVIDNLTYTYGDGARPDRLTNVLDAGNAIKGFKYTAGAAAYQYDLNGNLTQDNHKSLTLAYNYLNLPNYITNPGGSEITLTYTADGEKLSKVSTAGTRNYVTGIEYLGANLEAIYHGEGRCTPNTATTFYYEYTLKDHLGNARVNFRANGAAVTFLQELHYYPFGMLMEGIGVPQVTNNTYKYNGKELNEDLGLNLSDYGARWYDASLGRWWCVDPMGEMTANTGLYSYVLNNPLLLVDPDGMLAGNPFDLMSDRKKRQTERNEDRNRQIEEKEKEKDGMAIFIAFPDANPAIPTNQQAAKLAEKVLGDGDGRTKAGHAGVVIIDKEGITSYFDFGRYDRSDIKRKRGVDEGAVRSSKHFSNLSIPNWDFGKSDNKNVVSIMTKLHDAPELAVYGRMIGALAKGLDYNAMNSYARDAEYEGYLPFGGYSSMYNYCTSATYCAKFARGVGAAGGVDWDWDTFTGEGNVDDIAKDFSFPRVTIK